MGAVTVTGSPSLGGRGPFLPAPSLSSQNGEPGMPSWDLPQDKFSFPAPKALELLGPFAKIEIIFLNIGLITSLFCSRLIKVPMEGLIELKCL